MKTDKELYEQFYEIEFADWNIIKSYNRKDLLWEIWKERSKKLYYGIIGLLIGFVLGLIV